MTARPKDAPAEVRKADRDAARLLRKIGALAEEARLLAVAAPPRHDRSRFYAEVLLGLHRMAVTHEQHRADTDLLWSKDLGEPYALVLTFGPGIGRTGGRG